MDAPTSIPVQSTPLAAATQNYTIQVVPQGGRVIDYVVKITIK